MSAQNKPECEIYKKKPECEFSLNYIKLIEFMFSRLLFVDVPVTGTFSESCTPTGTFWEFSQSIIYPWISLLIEFMFSRLLFVDVPVTGIFSESCTPNGTFWEFSQSIIYPSVRNPKHFWPQTYLNTYIKIHVGPTACECT